MSFLCWIWASRLRLWTWLKNAYSIQPRRLRDKNHRFKTWRKAFEELLIDENDAKTEYESIFVAKNEKMDIQILNDYIKKLQDCQNIAEIFKRNSS